MANINDVAGIYANTQKQILTGGAQPQAQPAGGASFGDLVTAALDGAIQSQHRSEQVSAQALLGKADMTDLLQAVNDAQLALNTVLAIRDKVVQAYESVMRTQI